MEHSFLQSHEWERLQKNLGRQSWRIGGHLIIQHDLPQGFNYLYAPRLAKLDEEFLQHAREIALSQKSIFLKIDPWGTADDWKLDIQGWQFSNFIQPRKTVMLDLTKTEEGLLSSMHPKLRYNIRLAERHGVSVVKGGLHDEKFLASVFWDLLMETAERDVFHLHPKHYYEDLLAVKGDTFSNRLYFSEYHGTVLAAALVNFYHKTATYLHGASTLIHKEVMAPHYLHWRIMQDAKKLGVTSYDLWGIDEDRWPGVTRFKLGFGGHVVEHPQSIDIIFRPNWYRAYVALKKVF